MISRTFRMLTVLCLMLFALKASSQTLPDISPNGFKNPFCTWGADWVSYSRGWKLDFARQYNRDARLWLEKGLIRNGRTDLNYPTIDSIMVLGNSPQGHVAYIVNGYCGADGYVYVQTLHSNWPNPYGNLNDKSLQYQWWVYDKAGKYVAPDYYDSKAKKWKFGNPVPVLGHVHPR